MTTDDQDDGPFALPPKRDYPQHGELLESLPSDFVDGFEALEAHPQSEPHIVTITDDDAPGGGNFVFISLGRVHVGRFGYNHDRSEVFVRVNATFPKGQKYGFATDKVLKIDGQTPQSTQTDRDHADPLCDELGVDQVLYWSRKWDYLDVDPNDPDELTKAIVWTKTVLRTPFEE